ncbi:MAG TPA: preprotein translocase subunit YajC [Actinomycetota bacterium]
MIASVLVAQAARGNATFLISLGLMVAIFYFLLIRPQQRRMRQQRDLVQSLSVGDDVVTIGGMFGTIREMDDDEVTLEVAPGIQIRFVKRAIASKTTADELDRGAGEEA